MHQVTFVVNFNLAPIKRYAHRISKHVSFRRKTICWNPFDGFDRRHLSSPSWGSLGADSFAWACRPSAASLLEISWKADVSHFESSFFWKLVTIIHVSRCLIGNNRWHFNLFMCTTRVKQYSSTISRGLRSMFQNRCHRWASLGTQGSQIRFQTKVLHCVIHLYLPLGTIPTNVLRTIYNIHVLISLKPLTVSISRELSFSNAHFDRAIIIKQSFGYISVRHLTWYQWSSNSGELKALRSSCWISVSVLILMFKYLSQFLLLNLMLLQIFNSYASCCFSTHYSPKYFLIFFMHFPESCFSLFTFYFWLIISLLRNIGTWRDKMVGWNMKDLAWFLVADSADLLFERTISKHYTFYSFEKNTICAFDVSCSVFLQLKSFSIWNWYEVIGGERIPSCVHFGHFVSMQLIVFIVLYGKQKFAGTLNCHILLFQCLHFY